MSEIDWKLTTWEGNRDAQHEAFCLLSFREKILELERMSEVAAALHQQDTAAGSRHPKHDRRGTR